MRAGEIFLSADDDEETCAPVSLDIVGNEWIEVGEYFAHQSAEAKIDYETLDDPTYRNHRERPDVDSTVSQSRSMVC